MRKFFFRIVCLILVIGMFCPFRNSYAEEGYKSLVEAANTINEYLMDFGMYDSKALRDLCLTKGTEFFDYLYWQSDDESMPYASYHVYIGSESLEFEVNSEQYQGKIYLSFSLMGFEDYAYDNIE